jgi:signal transduction histidine kinase
LSASSQALASTLELNPDLILDQVRAIIDYTHAGLFVREESVLTALAVREPDGQAPAVPFRVRVSDPDALAALLDQHTPMRVADVWGETAEALAVRSLWREHAAVLLRGVRAWMWLPLAVGGRSIGGLSVARPERDYFTAHHAELAQTVANQAAITIVNAELYQQAQALAALQERQRLARNLHDAVNQSLFSAGLIAEVLPRLWERDRNEGRRSLEDLRRLTRGALAELRGLLGELRPSVLTDTDLGDLLRQLANALTGRTAVPVEVAVSGQGSLPPEVQVTLYRLCQEALSNIGKHAPEAQRVTLQLQHAPGAVELRIHDDGLGFDPDDTPAGHTGLSIMHERAESIGAALAISSRRGEGTTVNVRWTDTPERNAE